MEYEAIKLAAQKIEAMPQVGTEILVAQAYYQHIVEVQPIMVSLDELMVAWKSVVQRAGHFQHHKIGRAELSVREHMSIILRQLKQHSMMEFSALFDMVLEGIPKMVVHFLAILELAREGLIKITQQAAYTPIYLQINTSD